MTHVRNGKPQLLEHEPTVADILRCPLHIRDRKHYFADGTCRCGDPKHIVMMRRWGFRKKDGKWT